MKVFTTGSVARLCGVCPRTVSKWMDAGKLQGYRIPGSQDRRITSEHLLAFMRKFEMPIPEELKHLIDLEKDFNQWFDKAKTVFSDPKALALAAFNFGRKSAGESDDVQ